MKRTRTVALAVMVSAAAILAGRSVVAYADDPNEIVRTVLVSPDSFPGVGFGEFEGAHVLTLNLTGDDDWMVRDSYCQCWTDDSLWIPLSPAPDQPAKTHTWQAVGVLPDFTHSMACVWGSFTYSHLADFGGTLQASNGGGYDTQPFEGCVVDVDLDCDSDNDSTTMGRAQSYRQGR